MIDIAQYVAYDIPMTVSVPCHAPCHAREALGLLRELGASVRQLERLTGIGKGVIHRIWCAGR